MRVKTEDFSAACKNILSALDTKMESLYSETLELVANGDRLLMSVSNNEYMATVKFKLDSVEQFKAAVNAKLFLSLIGKITSDTIELIADGQVIKILGNGSYKLPMIYNSGELMSLPAIELGNITTEMTIKNSILQSILIHNSKELTRGVIAKPVQKYYYIDDAGAITFTSGACVNSFALDKKIKLLLSDKIVKLFKLFKSCDTVGFRCGVVNIENVEQTRVEFKTDDVTLTAKLSDSSLVSAVPVIAIRSMSTKVYPYSVSLNKESVIQALNRLMLFNKDKNYGKFEFLNGSVSISDWSGENTETISANVTCESLTKYSAILNMDNLATIVSGCDEENVLINFGDSRAFVIKKNNVSDILPELKAV